MAIAVEPMKKLRVDIQVGAKEDRYTFTPRPVAIEFIFGIGSRGLTPFEQMLEGKIVGDSLCFSVNSVQGHHFFGSLYHFIIQQAGVALAPPVLHIKTEITAIVVAENREVVKALAESLGHGGGCGGGCDCGCS